MNILNEKLQLITEFGDMNQRKRIKEIKFEY